MTQIIDEKDLEEFEKTREYKELYEETKKESKKKLEGTFIDLKLGLEFHEKIGEGGLGEVWRGDIVGGHDNHEVAIKVSKREKDSLNSLRKEAHIAGQLKHDDIGQILLYEENEERGMIIMDYIKGRNLLKIIERHTKLGLRMPQKFSAFISLVCCETLKYAHKARVYDEKGREVIGVLHRDISPGNIIINNLGYPKLLDFGIGILSSDLEDPNISTQIAGKLGFIAPEILEPEIIERKKIDQRIDIYGLGMVMDYLARGKNPLLEVVKKSSGKLEAMIEIKETLKKGIKLLEEDTDGMDEEYVKIIKKATKINRKERYSSAFHMKEDLRRYLFDKGYGPDRDRLKSYIELIYTTGLQRYLNALKKGENNIKIPIDFKNKIEHAKNLMPYMIKNGKFCLETLKDARYKTEELGYLEIY
ncbi:MAG: serine/threonine-protein kinase [Nanoarchaeota archaeon]